MKPSACASGAAVSGEAVSARRRAAARIVSTPDDGVSRSGVRYRTNGAPLNPTHTIPYTAS